MEFFNFLKEIGIAGFIDILFMSLVIYSVLIWFKKTKAAFVLTGIIIMAGVYLVAREFDLTLTASVLQGFFAVILIAIGLGNIFDWRIVGALVLIFLGLSMFFRRR